MGQAAVIPVMETVRVAPTPVSAVIPGIVPATVIPRGMPSAVIPGVVSAPVPGIVPAIPAAAVPRVIPGIIPRIVTVRRSPPHAEVYIRMGASVVIIFIEVVAHIDNHLIRTRDLDARLRVMKPDDPVGIRKFSVTVLLLSVDGIIR
jgi:hypothetical protein